MDRDERIAELEDALKRRDALIAELRAELVDTRKQSDARITELRAERDADRALAAEMAESFKWH